MTIAKYLVLTRQGAEHEMFSSFEEAREAVVWYETNVANDYCPLRIVKLEEVPFQVEGRTVPGQMPTAEEVRGRKKLSQIGTTIQPRPDSETQFYPFIQMTMEERRELVCAAIVRLQRFMWQQMTAAVRGESFDETLIERFLKDEGL